MTGNSYALVFFETTFFPFPAFFSFGLSFFFEMYHCRVQKCEVFTFKGTELNRKKIGNRDLDVDVTLQLTFQIVICALESETNQNRCLEHTMGVTLFLAFRNVSMLIIKRGTKSKV